MKYNVISVYFKPNDLSITDVENTKKQFSLLIERLESGWKIIRADATSNIIVYLLEKEE